MHILNYIDNFWMILCICIFGIFLYSQTCIPGWMMSHSWPALLHINEFINVPAGFIGLGKQWWTVQTWMMKYEIATGSTTFIESMNWMYEGYWVFIDLYILHFDTVMYELFSVCFSDLQLLWSLKLSWWSSSEIANLFETHQCINNFVLEKEDVITRIASFLNTTGIDW